MHKRKKAYFAGSLRHRLMLYFTLLMLLPLGVVGYLMYSISEARISDSALRLTSQIVEKDKESLDKVLSDMQAAAKMVIADEALQMLIAADRSSEFDRSQISFRMGERIRQISKLYENFNGLYILLDDGTVGKSRYYSVRDEVEYTGAVYQSIRNHGNAQWYTPAGGSAIVENMGDEVLSMATSLPSQYSGQPCGIVVVEVRQSLLRKITRADFGQQGSLFLTDSSGRILSAPKETDEAILTAAAEEVSSMTVGTKLEVLRQPDRIILCARVPTTGWILVGVVFKEFLQNDSQQILTTFLLVALLGIALNVVISRRLADYELAPITQMTDYVHLVERGEFDHALIPVRPDEIGALTENMRSMTLRIGELLETVKTEQERMRATEFRALQAQINPHFLYNTLDSINWLAREGDVQRTTEMVSALTTFFRIGLSKGRDMIPLREEIEHVRSYLVIQKIRYQDQFDYMICVDPQVENCFVPKLMLQPLVENALYHGIKLCPRRCMLMISALEKDGEILGEVLDNGVGMDAQTLEALRNALARTGTIRANSYGVVNVHDRIQILAGKAYGLRFTSEKDIGTAVQIHLPKILKGE